VVNEAAPPLALAEVAETPFRCDSARARDCFEMYQRHRNTNNNMTAVQRRALRRVASAEPSRSESIACGLKVNHRGDRCVVLRSGR
jgi:hypothetical protein